MFLVLGRASRNSMTQKYLLSLFLISVVLLPVYVFGSGGVQPVHAVLIVFFVTFFISTKFIFPEWALLLLFLVTYVFMVEFFYASISGNYNHIIVGFYFLFNFLISLSIYGFLRCEHLGTLKWALLFSLSVAVVGVLILGADIVFGNESGRAIGTFNNPNQLGYFAVCIGSITFLLHRVNIISKTLCIIMVACAAYLSILSLSKAAMISLAFMLVFVAIPHRWSLSNVFVMFIFFIAASASIMSVISSSIFADYQFYSRLTGMMNESDSSLAVRGYLVFLEGNAWQVFFGLGDGNVKDIHGYEVHSTIMGVLTNYGIVGFCFFVAFLSKWISSLLRSTDLVTVCGVCGPPMLYGVTHNGIRFTIFWILIALSLTVSEKLNITGKLDH